MKKDEVQIESSQNFFIPQKF